MSTLPIQLMKTMTLDEMKLAVCEKLSECMTRIGPRYYWKKDNKVSGDVRNVDINWSTEGLQVCNEAEKLLVSQNDWRLVRNYFRVLSPNLHEDDSTDNDDWRLCHATYEQRLEALCRVWWPERWS